MKPFFLPVVLSLLSLSCTYLGQETIRGNGRQVKHEVALESFKKIEVSGAIKLRVSNAPAHRVLLATDENLLEYIDIDTKGDLLIIRPKKGYRPIPSKELMVYISAPDIHTIDGSGSVNVRSENVITSTRSLNLVISGAGIMAVDVDAPQVHSNINGSGNMILKGDTEKLLVEVNGSGKVHSFDLHTQTANLELNGSADVEVNAAGKLNIEINGSGSVLYKGNPSINKSIAGSGKIRKAA